jgi:hypothetical protein
MPAGSQPDSKLVWFKSSYSGGNATECVEAAFISSGVLVRDSKRPEDSHISVPAEEWAKFVAHTRCIPRLWTSGVETLRPS